MSIRIREFVEADQDTVIALWRDCGLVVPHNDPVKDIRRKLAVGRELFLVAEDDAGIVGSVMGGYEGHRGWVNYLAVSPAGQRRGLGRTLMDAVEERLRALGCAKINLQVRSTNTDVIEFYRAIGYGQDAVVSFGKRLEEDT